MTRTTNGERQALPNLMFPPSATSTTAIPVISSSTESSANPSQPAEPELPYALSSRLRPRRSISTITTGTNESSMVFSEPEWPSTPATFASDSDVTFTGGVVKAHSSAYADMQMTLSDDAGTRGAGTRFENETGHKPANIVATIISETSPLEDESYKQVAQAAATLSEFQQAFGAVDRSENVVTDHTKVLDKDGQQISPSDTEPSVSAALVEVPIQISVPTLVVKLLVSFLLLPAVAVALKCLIDNEVPTALYDLVLSSFAERFTAARGAVAQIIGSSTVSWLAFGTLLGLLTWTLWGALYTLSEIITPQHCVERKVLPLRINGVLVDAWPDFAGINAMSKTAVNAFGLEIDTEKARLIRTGLGNLHSTCGQVTANVAFAGCSQVQEITFQEITFDVLPCWIAGMPEVTIGEHFLDKNNLLSAQDPRYETRPLPLGIYLVMFMDTTRRRKLRFLPISVMLSSGFQQVDALLDSGSTWDGMSLEYAALNYPLGACRHNWTKSVKCPDGTTVRTRWSVDATIQVAGQSIHRTFYIVPGLTRNIVLGHNFWSTYNPTERYRDLVYTIEDQDSEAQDHLTMLQVDHLSGWILSIGRKIRFGSGRVRAMTESDRLQTEIDKMDDAEFAAQKNDKNQMGQLSDAEEIRATRIRTAAKARRLKFDKDRQQVVDAKARAIALEQGKVAPAPSTLPVHKSAPQPDGETLSGAENPSTVVPSPTPGPVPPLSERTVDIDFALHPAITASPATIGPNEAAQTTGPGYISTPDSQDDHHQGLPNLTPGVRQHEPRSSGLTSAGWQPRPSSSGRAAPSLSLSHVSSDSQESYHTAATVVPHTPSFESCDPTLSQTNLASGLLTIPSTVTEDVAISSHSPSGHSLPVQHASEGGTAPTLPESSPESMVSNGDSPEDDGIPEIGERSQSLPIPAIVSIKLDVDAATFSAVEAESSI